MGCYTPTSLLRSLSGVQMLLLMLQSTDLCSKTSPTILHELCRPPGGVITECNLINSCYVCKPCLTQSPHPTYMYILRPSTSLLDRD